MLKKTITYTNLFTDEEVTEDHYFHLSKAELVEILAGVNAKYGEDVQAYLNDIQKVENRVEMIEFFKQLILKSYGKRSEDGKRFIKSQEIRDEFESSEAYSEFFMSIVTSDNPSELLEGLMPKGLDQEMTRIAAAQDNGANVTPLPSAEAVVPRILTEAEIREMDSDELKSGIATGRYKLS